MGPIVTLVACLLLFVQVWLVLGSKKVLLLMGLPIELMERVFLRRGGLEAPLAVVQLFALGTCLAHRRLHRPMSNGG